MREKCGVFGIYMKEKSYKIILNVIQGLEFLQHRGQESCGVAYQEDNELFCQTELGLVKNSFKNVKDDQIITNKCIGHVRYSTSGNSKNNVNNMHD